MSQSQPIKASPPAFDFTFPPPLGAWDMPARAYLAHHGLSWDGLATGALVFDSQNRILLLQRAAHDSMPNLWEMPGGAVDDDDASLLHGCARELWEESGLVAQRITRVVTEGEHQQPGSYFTNRTGERFFCRFAFEVDVREGGEVRLDPMEHQDFVWATEDEVREQRVGEKEIPLTNGQTMNLVTEGFRLHRLDTATGSALEAAE